MCVAALLLSTDNATYGQSLTISQSTNTFTGIQELMPRNRGGAMGSKVKWDFVLKKSRIATHRRRLKEIQQMFIFVKDAMSHSDNICGAKATGGSGAPSYLPILLTGTGRDCDGNPVSCSLKVTMLPAATSHRRGYARGPASGPVSGGEKEEEESTKDLAILRQSPYFSAALSRDQRDSAAAGEEERKSFRVRESLSATLEVVADDVAQREVDELLASVSRPGSAIASLCH